MKKTFLHTALCLLTLSVSVSCSNDSEENNPFDKQIFGDFDAKSIEFKKSSDNVETIEKWSDIVYNSEKKIIGYTYTRKTTGYMTENETRKCKLDYFTRHDGNKTIRTRTDVKYDRMEAGITFKYTENVQEDISMNSDGYITTIETTSDRIEDESETPAITTSTRTFTYDGDFCTGSTYSEGKINITYKYLWEAYQLKKITILKENDKDNTTDHTTYKYTFDTSRLSKFAGNETLPYVQSGFPQIFASMGYFGKFTPYILTEETQSGNMNYGDGLGSRPKTEIKISYRYDNNNNQELRYTGASRIYDTYSLTFSK